MAGMTTCYSGRVKPIDGEQFFEGLRRREDELLTKRSPE